MRPETKERAILAGAAAGAVIMGLLLSVIMKYGTGVTGIALMLLLILVSGAGGWMLGYQNRSRDAGRQAYQKGYKDGQRDAGITILPNPDTRMSFGFHRLYR